MVSTRGVKIKFSEGERVLCYEPDPTKAKVLYDSKVLQVVQNKDTKGKKQVEYLIHFQKARITSSKNATFVKGWNASWDRRVTEDYVLSDTEENRELQKRLAEKAKIKLSIKSNRVLLGSGSSSKERKRRRRLSETIRETIERERKNREGSDTSSQTGTGTTEDDMESISSSGMGSTTTTTNMDQDDDEEEEMSDEDAISSHVPIVIPEPLRDVIEKDFFLINEKNRLLDLPSRKCVLSILEDYVKFFAFRYIARSREKRRIEPKDKENSIMTLDLCKEVVDGFRICFDFYVHSLLLYPRERQQAENLKKATPIKQEQCQTDNSLSSLLSHSKSLSDEMLDNKGNSKLSSKDKDDKKEPTPRRSLRSKRPHSEEAMLVELKDTSRSQAPQQQLQAQQPPPSLSCESGCSTPTTLTSGISAADVTLSLSLEGKVNLPQQFKELNNWTLLPEQYRDPAPPVLLYGPHHLLRLFVKMPEIIYRMNLPGERRKIVLHHTDLFLEYLTLHVNDLFTESNYVNYVEP